MSTEFRVYDFTKLTPYLGPDAIFEDGPRPFVFSIDQHPLIYAELRTKLTEYLDRIRDATKGNFLSVSLYNLMHNRFYGERGSQIIRHETHLDELKWWQKLIKTIKYNSPNAWGTLPLIKILGDGAANTLPVNSIPEEN